MIAALAPACGLDPDQVAARNSGFTLSPLFNQGQGDMRDPAKLRELARWYREFAERTGNPMIWECRLHTAEDLDEEAARLERGLAAHANAIVFWGDG